MKKLLFLLPLTSCILNINTPSKQEPNRPQPRLMAAAPMMARNDSSGENKAYRSSVVLATYNTEKTRQKITKATQTLSGEVLEDGTYFIAVHIPSAELTNYIEGLKKFGKIESFAISGEDLSTPEEDNSLRISNLLQSKEQYQKLLTNATKTEDILSLTREIERIDSQLLYLNSAQKQMGQKTSFARVDITLQKRSGFGPIGWVLYIIYRGIKWFFWWD